MKERILKLGREYEADVIRWRRELHRFPELGGQEFRTAAMVEAQAERLGLAVLKAGQTGRIAILDPAYEVGRYEEEGRKGKVEMKNDFICLCDPQLLVADTATRDPGFYLFWRA